MKNAVFIIIIILGFTQLYSQSAPYEVELKPIQIDELGGLQSYAVGTYDGEWLIVGGRLDGLHMRQPFAAFDSDGNNKEIYVVNPISKKVWKKSVASLPIQIREQLTSSNMQFYQDDNDLIITGGYGYSPTVDDHITYPNLTVIDISSVIEDVKNGELASSDFIQIENELFRATGGRLSKIGDTFYLVGGHSFMGRYNPMGADHGPGFTQEYTNEIRKFKLIIDDEVQLNILSSIHDEMHLHRRDYNLVPIVSKGNMGLMAYSGVFQNNADLPWLYPVLIEEDSYEPLEGFSQYFNHYHCATLPIYDETKEEMNTIFFGGIAQFYMDGDLMVQDNDVPFVNTITNVGMSKDGSLSENVLNTTMPGYLGAGSEFIFSSKEDHFGEGILSGTHIDEEFSVVGYIYGGIRSSLPNIFWINTGEESNASNTIYQVSIRKRKTTSFNDQSMNDQKLFFYPNPAQNYIKMSLEMEELKDVQLAIFNAQGKNIHTQEIPKNDLQVGYNQLVLEDINIDFGAFIYKLKIGDQVITRKVIWTE